MTAHPPVAEPLRRDDDLQGTFRHQRQTTKRLRALTLLAAVLAVLSAISVVFWQRAEEQRSTAERQARLERAAKLAAMASRSHRESPSRAICLAVEALRATNEDESTTEALRALYESLNETHGDVLQGPSAAVTAIAVAPDGSLAAAAYVGGVVRVWTLNGATQPSRVLTSSDDHIWFLVFSRDGQQLIGASQSRLWLWRLSGPAASEPSMLGLVELRAGSVRPLVRVSADGSRMLALEAPGTIGLWDLTGDVSSSRHVFVWPGSNVLGAWVSPSGRWLAASDETSVGLVELPRTAFRTARNDRVLTAIASATGKKIASTGMDAGRVETLAVSDAGRLVVSTGENGRVAVLEPWDERHAMTARSVSVRGTAAGGGVWARVGSVRSMLLLETDEVGGGVQSSEYLVTRRLREQEGVARTCAVIVDATSPKDEADDADVPDGTSICLPSAGSPLVSRGQWLATDTALMTVARWSTARGSWAVKFPRGEPTWWEDPGYSALDLDAAGRALVTTTADGVVAWRLDPDIDDGRTLPSVVDDRERFRRDVSSPASARPPGCAPAGGSEVERSPDRNWAVVTGPGTGAELSAEIWSCGPAGARVATLGRGYPRLVEFDAASRHVAVEVGGKFSLWRERGGRWLEVPLEADGVTASVVSFSPDGRWLAIGGSHLWLVEIANREGHKLLALPLANIAARAYEVHHLVFRHDSRQLVATTRSGAERGQASMLGVFNIDEFRTTGEPILMMESDRTPRYSEDGHVLFLEDDREDDREGRREPSRDVGRALALPVARDELVALAERRAGRNLSVDEWKAAFGETPYHKTFPDLAEHPTRVIEAIQKGRLALNAGNRTEGRAWYKVAYERAVEVGDPSLLGDLCACATMDEVPEGIAACAMAAHLTPDPPPLCQAPRED